SQEARGHPHLVRDEGRHVPVAALVAMELELEAVVVGAVGVVARELNHRHRREPPSYLRSPATLARARRSPGPCGPPTYFFHTAQFLHEVTSVQPVPGDDEVEPSFIARLPLLPVMMAAYRLVCAAWMLTADVEVTPFSLRAAMSARILLP